MVVEATGHLLTHIFDISSAKVPLEAGHKATQRLVVKSPFQFRGQSKAATQVQSVTLPKVVELHLSTHLLEVSAWAKVPEAHLVTHFRKESSEKVP